MYNRIIAADDHKYILKLYQLLCQKYFPNYTIALAADGSQALEFIEQGIPDLLLLDIKMPGYSGLEVAGLYRQRYPHLTTPIVFVSGSLVEVSEYLKDIPNSFFLAKPFELANFIQLLTKLLYPPNSSEQAELGSSTATATATATAATPAPSTSSDLARKPTS